MDHFCYRHATYEERVSLLVDFIASKGRYYCCYLLVDAAGFAASRLTTVEDSFVNLG
jgi:hypothetical protein